MPKAPTEQNVPQVNMSTREVTTLQQLHNLLSVAGFMYSAMTGPPRMELPENIPQPKYNPACGEGVVAAEQCFIKTCTAIERIVEEVERWDFSFQKRVEDDYARAMKLNLEYIQAKRDEAVEMGKPHMLVNPSLAKMADGTFMAFLGNLQDPSSLLAGSGRSPQEALDAFDTAFVNTQQQQQQQTEIKPNEQIQQVDPAGTGKTEKAPRRRRINPRVSPGTGPHQESGGAGPGPV